MWYSNRGMYLENLIEQSSIYYKNKNICLIFKRNIPISIIKNNNGYIEGKLKQKSTSDYYGCYKTKMFDFEAKQTNKTFFCDELIKTHQKEHLLLCRNNFEINSFILIHFVYYDRFFAIDIIDYMQKIKETKTIKFNWFENNAFELKIIFPGIIDIISYLEYWSKKYGKK